MLLPHVRSLETFGVTGAQYSIVLTPLLLSKLPAHLPQEWAREGAGHESDLDFPAEFSTDGSTVSVNSREGCVTKCGEIFFNSSGRLPFARNPAGRGACKAIHRVIFRCG